MVTARNRVANVGRQRARGAAVTAVAMLWLVAAVTAATAQDAVDVADELARSGAVVEASGVDLASLRATADDRSRPDDQLGFVVLDDAPVGGSQAFADDVLDAWGADATVVLLTDEDVVASSAVHDDAAIDTAFDASFPAFRDGEVVEAFDAFGAALPGRTAATGATDDGGVPWGLVVFGLFLVGLAALFVTSARSSTKRREAAVATARTELSDQLTALGEQVFDLEPHVTLSEDEVVTTRFAEATATFREVRDEVDTAPDANALEALADRVDHARWQLAAVAAQLDGRPVPPEPTPEAPATASCFFDPAHPPATEDATVRTSAGSAEVQVCPACADRLRAGDAPTPRQLDVGGQRVPAPRAPRSHGGRSLDWLSGAAEVLVGGMSRGAPIDLGRASRRRRRPRRRSATRRTPVRARQPKGRGGRSLGGGGRTSGRGGRDL